MESAEEKSVRTIGKYTIVGNSKGMGSFGKVYKVKNTSGESFAIKSFNEYSDTAKLEHEYDIPIINFLIARLRL